MRCSTKPHRLACFRNLELNPLRLTTLCVILRLCAKPCKVKQWAILDSNPRRNSACKPWSRTEVAYRVAYTADLAYQPGGSPIDFVAGTVSRTEGIYAVGPLPHRYAAISASELLEAER